MYNNNYWITKDGCIIYPSQMGYSHMMKVLEFLELDCEEHGLEPRCCKFYNLLTKEIENRVRRVKL